jgi:hypothetical protein
MSKPNYFLYFIISVLAIFVPISALLKLELNNIRSKAVKSGYAQVIDGRFVWNDNIQ